MAAKKKGVVFRVTGLPASQPDDELKEALKAAIDDNLAEDEKSKVTFNATILPSCYDNEKKVALVEFHGGVPEFLSELTANPLDDWQVEMGDTDIDFDRHFFGFTQLYMPKPDSTVTADIIAITGLDGHAYGSWRGKGNLRRMWLRDFLCKDMPCCRTMIYGYNSKLLTHRVDTIMDYGQGLLEELKKIRNTEELRKRPLFFIAHSFGGIILAHCLIKAVQADEDDHPTIASLYRATYGMLLFGIPHKGLVVDDIQKIVAGQDNHPRSALLEQIKSKSDLLAFQLMSFRNLIRDRKVVSFFEMGQTRQLEFDSESSCWRRTGDFVTVVDADSALLQLPDSMEDKIPLDADHSIMVKFNNKSDLGYSSARDKLRQFEQDATSVVAARFLRSQNRLKPSIMVPFQRDSAFVGRVDILVKISEKFMEAASQDHSRVALVGLGGVGKSQIAIEYAYRVRESAPQTWVFWVHASNAGRFKQAYTNIAAKIELPGRDDPNADILRLVYNWLSDERNGRWLIILDNADDDQVFHSTSEVSGSAAQATDVAAPLASFLPQSSNGWVLVTSRDLAAAMNLVGIRDNVFHVEPMPEEEALMLLKTRVSVSKAFEDDAKTLIQILEYIPLAITHAAAYIAVRAQTITVSTYLELFRESEENQAHLLSSQESRDMRRDGSISSAVVTTWQISFEQIQKMRPESAELLSLMAMFDRQGIPESILYDGKSRLQFEDAVAPLTSFSLIKVQSVKQLKQQVGEHLFEMHDLVQLATRKWLEEQMQLGRWQKASLRVMAASFPNGSYETRAACRAVLPHARKVFGHILEDREATLDRALVADSMAWYLYNAKECAAAEPLVRTAIIERGRVLGEEHIETISSLSLLGSVLEEQGKYKEAEATQRQALEGYIKAIGEEHTATLTSVRLLGLALERQGKYEEAEAMHQRSVQGLEKVVGEEHIETLMSVTALGLVYRLQGKFEKAEAMQRRVVEGYKKVVGEEHPYTLISIAQLGLLFELQGKYEEAEAIQRQALEAKMRILGEDDLSTLISIGQLGLVLDQLNKYDEAEVMQRRALEGYMKVVGEDHPDTLVCMTNLAALLLSQRRLKEAEDMAKRSIDAMERLFGRENPDTIATMQILATTLKLQGRIEEAISLIETCFQLRERVLGRHHPHTENSLKNMNKWRMENI
ncbi:hypothetical protein VE04_08927 [Pseudogymnoascus sp. 24MN13]|nr:hypothetical protein VE04_08927 [Pseudogymnoascus sp. 24MN13]